MEYSKYLDKEKRKTPDIVDHSIRVMRGQCQNPGQVKKFTPIVSVQEFFKEDDKPYSALRNHPLESSPCYPIIGARAIGKSILYYCELCNPEVININLSSIEHHSRYNEGHKAEILKRLSESKTTIV